MLIGTPYIPETITVHLGTPDSNAANVTVSFPEYVKNVASSEIYPTWNEAALRANIYVIVSFALNRIYTEWYRSRGYDFDITSSTQFDQKFINGREVFENISNITDELFNDYVRRQGSVEPLFTAFCNGTTVTCGGLSQWGSEELARQGLTPYEILKRYYGDDIEIVKDAPVQSSQASYPGFELKPGDGGNEIRLMQVMLNRISRNYPAIPKIPELDGIYDPSTEEAVKTFQGIFNLQQTGVIDEATWYKITYIYSSVKRVAELNSEGVKFDEVALQYSEDARIGMQGVVVRVVQYYLAVIGAYYEAVSPVDITGYFGSETEEAVKSFQRVFGLPQTGVVDRRTWNDLNRAYQGIVDSVPFEDAAPVALYPGTVLKEGVTSEYVRILQKYLTAINSVYPEVAKVSNTGYFGPLTKQSVMAFQKLFDQPVTGVVGASTWDLISGTYSDIVYGTDKRPFQNPGYTIK